MFDKVFNLIVDNLRKQEMPPMKAGNKLDPSKESTIEEMTVVSDKYKLNDIIEL